MFFNLPIMSTLPASQEFRRSRLTLIPSMDKNTVKIRLRVQVHHPLHSSSIFYHLTSKFGLAIAVSEVSPKWTNNHHFDLEMTGTIERMKDGLNYLENLGIKLQGKANPDGDSWYC